MSCRDLLNIEQEVRLGPLLRALRQLTGLGWFCTFIEISLQEALSEELSEAVRAGDFEFFGSLFEILIALELPREGPLLEDSGNFLSVSAYSEANAVLFTLLPLTSIRRAIGPVHLAIAVLKVSIVASFIIVARSPLILSFPMFQVVAILTLVCLAARRVPPDALARSQALDERSRVCATVSPLVLPVATR